MKRLIALCIVVFLLSGCGIEPPAPPQETSEAPPAPTIPAELPEPHPQLTQKEVDIFSFHDTTVAGMTRLGENLLLLSQKDGRDVLTALDPRTMEVKNVYAMEGTTFPSVNLLHMGMSGFSYYSDETGEIIQVDGNLQEVNRISLPEDIIGAPIFSQDYGVCYYGTADGIWSWDVHSGVTAILLKDPAPYKNMEQLLSNDQILQCALGYGDKGSYVYLNTADGTVLWRDAAQAQVSVSGTAFYARLREGLAETLVFGTMGQEPVSLIPREDHGKSFYLPLSGRAISYQEDGRDLLISCYDLSSGLRTGQVDLQGGYIPFQAVEIQDWIFLLGEESLGQSVYRWNPADSPIADDTVYTGPWYTAQEPDKDGLQHCLNYAQELSDRHGVNILVWNRAVEVPPWDYDLIPEYQVPVIMRQLQLLDGRLRNYPDGMLRALSEDCGGLNISLVREIMGKENSGSLSTAKGLQYWDKQGGNYIVLAHDTEYTLYHELCHVIDNYIAPRSHIFDSWNNLNPKDFEYDMDYQKNVSRNGDKYLRSGSRSFIDTYSMSFPTEDRARIMEYAMTEGNAFLFRSETMQKKLYLLSYGIREVFGLLDSPRAFPWEQYLNAPFSA